MENGSAFQGREWSIWCKFGSLVGRAVALAQAGDIAAGFAALEALPSDRVANYQPYWAARGHLLELLERTEDARQSFTRAAGLTDDPALREYLFHAANGGPESPKL